MARGGKLSAKAAATSKPGTYRDGNCLELHVSPTGSAHWVCNFTMDKKRQSAGLGSRTTVSLAEARERNLAALKLRDAGINPIEAKRKAKQAAEAAKAKPTFGAVADALMAAKQPGWRNPRHAAQWRVTLETYAKPLWSRPVDEIDTAAVLSVLAPIWAKIPETASRVRGRIEAVLNAAKAQGHRQGENPAAWRGHLEHVLTGRGKFDRGRHAAMDYAEVSTFVAQLREKESVSALALEFTILTAARLGEVLGAQWDEIDMQAKVWTIPGARMKAGVTHRVPLCERAVEIVERMKAARTDDLLFPGRRSGRPLAGPALLRYMRGLGVETATVHGFRSAFRDWAGEETHFPRDVCEQALAHAVGNQVERSYRRGDALEKRRELMTAWANYIEPRPAASNVIPLRG